MTCALAVCLITRMCGLACVVLNDLDAEKARCEELSIELLNLVNAKNIYTIYIVCVCVCV